MYGKKEGIENEVISTANNFLISDHRNEVYQAVLLIMNCAINLDGKKQATYFEDDQVIRRLIALLEYEDDDIHVNVC